MSIVTINNHYSIMPPNAKHVYVDSADFMRYVAGQYIMHIGVDHDSLFIDWTKITPYIVGSYGSVLIHNRTFSMHQYTTMDVLDNITDWLGCTEVACLAATCRTVYGMLKTIYARSNKRRDCSCYWIHYTNDGAFVIFLNYPRNPVFTSKKYAEVMTKYADRISAIVAHFQQGYTYQK